MFDTTPGNISPLTAAASSSPPLAVAQYDHARRFMRQTLAFAFMVLLCVGGQAGQPLQVLLQGHTYCPESEVEALAKVIDASTDIEARRLIESAVNRGSCTVATESYAAGEVQRGSTPGGHGYSCFQVLDMDQARLSEQRHCAQASSVISFGQAKAMRQGGFKLLREVPERFLTHVRCVEGGEVVVVKRERSWERLPLSVLPLTTKPISVPSSQSRQIVLRDGCRGVDYPD